MNRSRSERERKSSRKSRSRSRSPRGRDRRRDDYGRDRDSRGDRDNRSGRNDRYEPRDGAKRGGGDRPHRKSKFDLGSPGAGDESKGP